MRSALLVLAATLVFAATGCNHHNLSKNSCASCGQAGQGALGGHAGHGGPFANGGYGGGGLGGGAYGGGGYAAHNGSVAPSPVARLGHQYNQGPVGPPSATVAYPYYTVRAPRDFLMDNPPSIGY